MNGKRRLGLMPELLPAPPASPSSSLEPGASSVRSRTLARWKVLAAIGAAGLSAEGCDGWGYTVVDPLPAPACPKPTPTLRAVYLADPPNNEPDSGLVELPIRRRVELTVESTDPAIAIDTIGAAVDERLLILSQERTATGFRAVLRGPAGEYELPIGTTCSNGTNRGDFTVHLVLRESDVTAEIR